MTGIILEYIPSSVCLLLIGSVPGYNTLGSIYLWVVLIGPLVGKGDNYVSQPLMVYWVCLRTLIYFLGYTTRYNTPRLLYLALFLYIGPQVFYLFCSLIKRLKCTASMSGHNLEIIIPQVFGFLVV